MTAALLAVALVFTPGPAGIGEDARAGGVAFLGEWHQTGSTDPDGIHVIFAESNVSSKADTSKRSGVDQGDIVVTGRKGRPDDSLAGVNAKAFEATQTIDRALVGPVALAYKRVLPPPVRSGLRNFLYNLHEPDVLVNYLLQFKPGKAVETLGRFALNSTLGVGGLVDVAKRRPFKLPRRPNGFADTFGIYGIKNGLFLYVPLIGPTTLRDLVGGMLDRFVLPVAVGSPFNQLAFSVPVGVLSTLDHRAEFDDQLHALHDGVADPYETSRDFYLRRRKQEIDHIRGKEAQSAMARPADAAPPVDAVQPLTAQTLARPGDRDSQTTKTGGGG